MPSECTSDGDLPLATAINGVMLERVATLTEIIFLVVVTQPLLLSRLGDRLLPLFFLFLPFLPWPASRC